MEGRKGINHTDPNTMSLSASFPGATLTISLLVVFVVVVVLAVDILLNCSAAFLSLVKVVRLLLTESVIRTPLGEKKILPFFFFLNLKKVCMFKGVFFLSCFPPLIFLFFSFLPLLFAFYFLLFALKTKTKKRGGK